MIQIDLSGKVILITGAMGAIAEHIVKRLNAAGAMLVLVDLKSEAEAKETLNRWNIPDKTYVYHALDITDSQVFTQIVDKTFERFPHMDTVLGHAGGWRLHQFDTTPESEFERIVRFNFLAQVVLTRAVFAQWMKRKIAGQICSRLLMLPAYRTHKFRRMHQRKQRSKILPAVWRSNMPPPTFARMSFHPAT